MSDQHHSVRILLVEDNPADAELCIRSLRKHNLENDLVWVKDGAEALDFLLGGSDTTALPQVVLLDLKLPKVDGLEVLAKIKGDPAMRHTPIVMLTSSREESDLVRSYQLGVNAFVVKPVGFREFFEAIQDVGIFWAVLNEPPPRNGRTP